MATTPYSSGKSTIGGGSGTGGNMRESAAKVGADVKQQAIDRAEEAQHKSSESMRKFAQAIRSAGDELAAQDQGAGAQLMAQAAGSLEQMSDALGQKRFEDIVSDVRHFGRRHPGAFIASSVLLGLALGRFAQSAATDSSTQGSMPASQPSASGRTQHDS